MGFVQLYESDLPLIWKIRQESMYQNDDISIVKLPKDSTNIHFGYKVNEVVVAVITIEAIQNVYQFRKFATLPNHQQKGIGSKLLNEVLGWMQVQGAKSVWCNARKSATEFYQKFGMFEDGEVYTKNNIQFIKMKKEF